MAVVLVDTSIWLEIERGRFDIEAHLDWGEIAIRPPIAQELLQGARDRERYRLVWETIFGAVMLEDPMPLETFERAAQIFRDCRDAGHNIVSSYDCVIAACAIVHKVPLLQRDADFEFIAQVAPLELLPNR